MTPAAHSGRDHGGNEVHPDPKRVRIGEDFDLIIGFLAFWALVLLVVTVYMELTAQSAVAWAVGLLVVVLMIWGMVVLRRRLPARTGRRHS
ncbi:hypothetical protein [Arthrobacter sp. M4]|uniref:hypothetical protein n=1 Tax=Arthrobacter sp. M4 TaxID=218160 RepID=UPI001CDBDF58|nr:hypothetical protein [Arthrobacter sp. M4]MCA4134223.1 hypothetical protein [Arthrobacter sp. M4]